MGLQDKMTNGGVKPVEDKATDMTPYVFNESAFTSKVVALEELRDENVGKKNMNSSLWFAKTVKPLVTLFKAGNRTEQLFQGLMTIKAEVPLINPKLVEAQTAPATKSA